MIRDGWDEAWLAQHTAQFASQPAAKAKRARREPKEAVLDPGFAYHCKLAGLPMPTPEHAFAKESHGRKWRFDFAWVEWRIAVEKEGIVYPERGSNDHRLSGRHVSVTGFRNDVEKYAAAFTLGWAILRCLPEHIESGQAALWVAERVKHGTTLR